MSTRGSFNPVLFCASCLWRCGLGSPEIQDRTGLGVNVGNRIRASLGANWAPQRKAGGGRSIGSNTDHATSCGSTNHVTGYQSRPIPVVDLETIQLIDQAANNLRRPLVCGRRLFKAMGHLFIDDGSNPDAHFFRQHRLTRRSASS